MTPEEIGMASFGISLRDSDFAHIKTAQELTDKTMAAVLEGIRMAIQAEREACAGRGSSSARKRGEMKISAYLLIDGSGSIQVRKNPPAPHLQQVVVKIVINIDSSWFRRAIPSVQLDVPNDYAQPTPIIQIEPVERSTQEISPNPPDQGA